MNGQTSVITKVTVVYIDVDYWITFGFLNWMVRVINCGGALSRGNGIIRYQVP